MKQRKHILSSSSLLQVLHTFEQCEKRLNRIEHLWATTYPLLQEKKMLLSISLSLRNLTFELTNLYLTLITQGTFPTGNTKKNNLKLIQLAKKGTLPRTTLQFLQEMEHVTQFQKNSTVRFGRNDTYVLCDTHYHMLILTEKKVTTWLKKTKLFKERVAHLLKN